MKQQPTEFLDIAYLEGGPRDGPIVLCLHGWPDDPLGLETVAAYLQQQGFRTIAPWLRGFGHTSFRSPTTMRDGRALVLAQDAIDLLDALGIERCTVLGHDWGGRAAYNLAALVPDRIDMIAVLAIGYAPFGRFVTPGFEQAKRWWYQWLMNSDGGADRVRADPVGFARQQWNDWSPPGWYDAAAFERTAQSFTAPDWSSITLHGYRSRWLPEPVDPRYAEATAIVSRTGQISVPTLLMVGAEDRCDPPEESAHDRRWFDAQYRRIVLPDVGHFPGREAPEAVATALAEFRATVLNPSRS